MRIATRLAGLSSAGALALLGVGLLGVAGIRSLQHDLNEMNSSVAPLQQALFERQQLNEQAFGAIQELVQAGTAEDMTQARHRIDQTLTDIDRVMLQVQELDDVDPSDETRLLDAYAAIGSSVEDRLASVAAARAETLTSRELLDHVDELILDVSERVDKLTAEAVSAAHDAQERLQTMSTERAAASHMLSTLAELSSLSKEIANTTNRYRLTPLRLRVDAAFRIAGRTLATHAVHHRLEEATAGLDVLESLFMNPDTGQFARAERELSGQIPAGDRSLASRQSVRTHPLNTSHPSPGSSGSSESLAPHRANAELKNHLQQRSVRLLELIDRIDFEIAFQRKKVSAALALVGNPRSISALNRELLIGAQQMRAQLVQMMLANEPAMLELALSRARKLFSAMMQNASVLQVSLTSLGTEAVQFNAYDLNLTFNTTRESIDKLNSAIGTRIRSNDALDNHLRTLGASFQAQRLAGQQRLDEVTRQFADQVAEVDGEVTRAVVLIVLIALLAVLGSAVFSTLIIRSIVRRLQHARAVAESVSQGVLIMAGPGHENDELSGLFDALFAMVTMLDTSVRQIREASQWVNQGAKDISTGNRALSDRTDQQAERLTETATSTRRITDLVNQGADTIDEVSGLSLTASVSVGKGNEVAQEAISKMQKIETGAHQIDSIVAIIDDIAIQTNILALNAAVEAARAGNVGKGFAIVAQEVRDLARKSKDSASQIKHIVELNVSDVEAGTTLVRNAGDHLEQALSDVDKVAQLVRDVSAAARLQAESITRIDATVVNLESMTQENALLSEQSSSAAKDLVNQAQRLDQAVRVFQLAEKPYQPAGHCPGEHASSNKASMSTCASRASASASRAASTDCR